MPSPTDGRKTPAGRCVRPARAYYGWSLVLVLGVVAIVCYGCTQYLFGVLVVPIGRELRCSRAALSGVYSTGLLVAAALGVPVGRVVDRHGARLAVPLGALVGALSLAALAQAHTLTEVFLCWSLGVGITMALTLYPVTFVVVANWFEHRRASAMALLTTLGGLSATIYIPLAGRLTDTVGWRRMLLVCAGTELALVPLAAAVIRRRPEDLGLRPDGGAAPDVADEASVNGDSARVALRRPEFWLMTLAGSAGMLAANMVGVHQVPYLISRGVRPVTAASIAGLVGVASLPSRLSLNLLSARIRGTWLLGLAFLAMAASVVVLATSRGTAGFVGYALVYGTGVGAVNALRATVMAGYFGRRSYGAITGAQNLIVLICSAAGPYLAGWLYDLRGDYQLALSAIFAAALLAAGVSAFAPAPRASTGAWSPHPVQPTTEER